MFQFNYYYKFHPCLLLLLSLSFGLTILTVLSLYGSIRFPLLKYNHVTSHSDANPDGFPFPKLRNLVMVAGHSVYTSSDCGKVESENSWFLEAYQKHPGQAATFLDHIKEGVHVAAEDDEALLLFSGGETRKDAGPRSEAQSYWLVADSKHWFGEKNVRRRALTEEHARDSFENLLFSVCRFRELTGTYPQNITCQGPTRVHKTNGRVEISLPEGLKCLPNNFNYCKPRIGKLGPSLSAARSFGMEFSR